MCINLTYHLSMDLQQSGGHPLTNHPIPPTPSQDQPSLHQDQLPPSPKRPNAHSEHHLDQLPRKILHLDNQNHPHNSLQSSPEMQTLNCTATKQCTPQKEQASDPLVSLPLREKYAHLIPEYQSAGYTLDQKMLLRIQGKLDQHLQYLKQHRGKKRGDYFKRCHIIVDLSQIKQIVFIHPELYICTREEDNDHHMDILVNLPAEADLSARKIIFKQKLYAYLMEKGAFQAKRKDNLVIPQFKFSFEEKVEEGNMKTLKKQLDAAENTQMQEEAKEQSKLTLKHMFSKDFKFKDVLYQKIQEKENKIKEMAKIGPQTERAFDKRDALKVLDELHLAYTAKKISNMFRATLLDKITKQLNMQDQVATEILQFILQKTQGYLKKVSHHKGPILQMDRLLYGTARAGLLGGEL